MQVRHCRARAVRVVSAAAATVAFLPTSFALAAGAPALGGRLLRQGLRGSDVRTLQSDLSKVGYKTGADGIFGPQTARSVRSFERHYHLQVDGIAGPAVVHELKSVLARSARRAVRVSSAAPGARTLQEGMTGTDVSALQQDLTNAGYPTSVDGDFGPATRASVLAFQQANGLAATGVFTAAELPMLQKAAASSATAGVATINSDGSATPPPGTPAQVAEVFAGANQIIDKPYVYGGGHRALGRSRL